MWRTLRELSENERLVALNVADRNVLLLFPKGASTSPTVLPGGVIPPHDGSGDRHAAELDIDPTLIASRAMMVLLAKDWETHQRGLMQWQRELLKPNQT